VRVSEPRDVAILGRMIRLGQLLKLAGAIDSGSDAKHLLAAETVLINGEPDIRRGRQLHHGDVVSVGGEELRVVVPGQDEEPAPPK
jgi:ribosome-associated protein